MRKSTNGKLDSRFILDHDWSELHYLKQFGWSWVWYNVCEWIEKLFVCYCQYWIARSFRTETSTRLQQTALPSTKLPNRNICYPLCVKMVSCMWTLGRWTILTNIKWLILISGFPIEPGNLVYTCNPYWIIFLFIII